MNAAIKTNWFALLPLKKWNSSPASKDWTVEWALLRYGVLIDMLWVGVFVHWVYKDFILNPGAL
jgi:hypothetical protein